MASNLLREDFERAGFSVLRSVLQPRYLDQARRHFVSTRDHLGLPTETAIVAAPASDVDADRLAHDESVLNHVSAVLGDGPRCFGVSYIHKPAFTGLPALWHQDGEPWQGLLQGARALSAWIPLDDADESNGCLVVVPGSHGLQAQPLRLEPQKASIFGAGMDLDLVEEAKAVALTVTTGDLVLHHPNLIHRSEGNSSGRPRTALVMRYRSA